jgi:hypothetical protein
VGYITVLQGCAEEVDQRSAWPVSADQDTSRGRQKQPLAPAAASKSLATMRMNRSLHTGFSWHWIEIRHRLESHRSGDENTFQSVLGQSRETRSITGAAMLYWARARHPPTSYS